MDLRRHITAGRLSELVGKDGLDTDKVIRTMGWRRIAEEELPTLKPQTRQMLQAYADGVNTYLRGRTPRDVAIEYTILGLQLPTAEIEEWTPVDSLAWLKAMAWDLKGNYADELARARLFGRLTPAQISQIYPAYDYEAHPPILGTDEWSPRVPDRATKSAVPSALTTVRHARLHPGGCRRGARRRPAHQCGGAGRVREGARRAERHPAAGRARCGHRLELVGRVRGPHHHREAAARQRPAPRGQPARHLDPEQPELPHRVAGLPARRQRLLVRRRAGRDHRPQRRHRVGLHQPRARRHRLLPRAGRRRHLPARRRLGAGHHPPGGHQGRRRRRPAHHGPQHGARAGDVRRHGRPLRRRGQGSDRPGGRRERVLPRVPRLDRPAAGPHRRRHPRPQPGHRLRRLPGGRALLRRARPEPALRRPRGPHRLPGTGPGAAATPGHARARRPATGRRPAGTRPTTGRASSSSPRCRGRSTRRTA